ncbi:hypothetical protein [Acidovorax sp. 1608163]|uniref:hypothetical protein n=1 Tax=Acidovorax sp. 1608163 TaxID=2478662 RepID=UPI0013CE7E79|nr:hypothetical protein [Acidovorax sp. 1608163]
MLSSEARFSRGQVLEVLDDSAQLYGEVTDSDDPLLDIDLPGDGIESDDESEADLLPDASPVRNSVRNEAKAAEWFSHLEFRQKIFGASYPFEISEDRQELCLRPTLDESQRLYIQLLLSSSLRTIPKKRWPDLTEPFEEVSEKIFSSLMPKGWNVHRFGAKGSTRYTGKLYEKLAALAKDIRAEFTAPRHYYSERNTGDGGLDLVAWHSMGDERICIPAALAQCGCVADDWTMKTLEASPARLGANLRSPVPWTAYYFMPQDLLFNAGNTTDWHQGNDLTNAIIIDRYRLIKLASDYDLLQTGGLTSKIVDEALAFKSNAV